MPKLLLAASVFISSDAEVTFSTWYCCHQDSPVFLFTVVEWQWKSIVPRIMVSQRLTQNGWPKLYEAQLTKNLVGSFSTNIEMSLKRSVPFISFKTGERQIKKQYQIRMEKFRHNVPAKFNLLFPGCRLPVGQPKFLWVYGSIKHIWKILFLKIYG